MKYFSPKEFECKCGCGLNNLHPAFDSKLDWLRTIVGGPVRVNSACRCHSHNAKVGGKPHSYHLNGMAVDLSTKTVTNRELFIIAVRVGFGGVIQYENFVHVDLRPTTYIKPLEARLESSEEPQ